MNIWAYFTIYGKAGFDKILCYARIEALYEVMSELPERLIPKGEKAL